ncbi:RNB domain-containing ribonuclease [candidate division KSB1 bacterium]|nr:RNB domain-containing ribonuclease [candidate division KSB1 bacterium]
MNADQTSNDVRAENGASSSAEAPQPAVNAKDEQRQKLFQALFDLFRESLKKQWTLAELQQLPLARRLLRLANATYEQRSLYPLAWRQQFVRQARTLHSLTGFRDIRVLLYRWLRQMAQLPATADLFVSAEPRLRRHLDRLAAAENIDLLTVTSTTPATSSPRHILTVDNPETDDRDDALSFRRTETGEEIGVHVPNLTNFVLPGSEWDRWAEQVAVSTYLPHVTISMLPEAVNAAASLSAHAAREVLSFYFVREAGEIRFDRPACETIRIDHNAHYEEVETWLETGAPGHWSRALPAWVAGAQQFETARIAAGGRVFDREQVDVRVDASGRVELRRYAQNSAARKTVAEWMIAANQAAAAFCHEHGLPCLYRTQENASAPEEEMGTEPEQRFSRPQLSVQRAPHRDLGLAGYTQVTSPLRRYVDLLMQRQIITFLQEGAPRYSEEELRNAASTLEFMSQRLQKLQSRAEFYYKCVYLSQHIGVPLPGEICHSPAPARSVVLRLPELAVRLFVPQSCIKGLSMRQIPPYGTTMPVLASCLEMDADRALMVFQVKKAAGNVSGKQPEPTA